MEELKNNTKRMASTTSPMCVKRVKLDKLGLLLRSYENIRDVQIHDIPLSSIEKLRDVIKNKHLDIQEVLKFSTEDNESEIVIRIPKNQDIDKFQMFFEKMKYYPLFLVDPRITQLSILVGILSSFQNSKKENSTKECDEKEEKEEKQEDNKE